MPERDDNRVRGPTTEGHACGETIIRQAPLATMCSISLLSPLLGGPVLAWVRTVYTRLSGTNDRAPFRPERTGNFPVAANETAADMLCCALYPRIQTFPSTDLHLHGGDLVLVLCAKSTSVNRRSACHILSYYAARSSPKSIWRGPMAGLLTNLEPHDSKGRLRKSYV